MNKIVKGALSVCCAAVAAIGLASCSGGASAYEIAVKNGYEGTESQWLEHIQGDDGKNGNDLNIKDIYEEARKEGYEGEFLDFLKEYLSADVKENNDTAQIAENIMSVVSVDCGFGYKEGGGWMGYGSTIEYKQISGSGVIIDLDEEKGTAYVVTNYHVIYDSTSIAKNGFCDNIWCYPYGALNNFDAKKGGQSDGGMKAELLGGAMDYDIALLKISGDVLKEGVVREAKCGDSDKVTAGEKVYAIGNPEGAGISVTSGLISVESEYIRMTATDGVGKVSYRVMRTDAAINGGNSGGALFNAQGELIGITNAKSIGEETDNMGFALPITPVKYLLENIWTYGTCAKVARLGATVSVRSSSAHFNDGGELEIVEVLHVTAPAAMNMADYGKFEQFDVLEWVQIGEGEKHYLTRAYQLDDLLLTVRMNDTVTFGVKREGNVTETVSVEFGKESYFKEYA